MLTALIRDAEFAAAFRERFIAPKPAVSAEIFQRARDRGEIRDDVDLDLIAPALAGICLHRLFLMGLPPDKDDHRAASSTRSSCPPRSSRPARRPGRHPADREQGTP